MTRLISTGFGQLLKRNFSQSANELSGLIEKAFAFLSVSSLFIGGTGFFKTFFGYILLGMQPAIDVCMAVFLISFSVYTLDKVADLDKDVTNMPERLRFLKGRKNLAVSYSIGAYLLSILLILADRPISVLVVLIPLIANAAYGTRLIPGLPRLKDIPVMKNLVVALSWALVTILIPAMHLDTCTSMIVAIGVYFMLVKTFIDTVLYDVRDLKGDRENGVKTLPVLIGTKKTAILLLALNSTLLLTLLLIDSTARWLVLALTIYGYAYILYFRERRNPLLLDFYVEGEWMLACIVLVSILREIGLI